jgi:hypothetical protein
MRFFESTPLKLIALTVVPVAVLGIVKLASHGNPPAERTIKYVCSGPPPAPMPAPAPAPPTNIYVTA